MGVFIWIQDMFLKVVFFIFYFLHIYNIDCKPAMDQFGGMSDAIQYLNDLDQFYSAQVRPSFPRKRQSFSLIGDSLKGNARPRFGKRSNENLNINDEPFQPLLY